MSDETTAVMCYCGAEIHDYLISYFNGENEEGDLYCVVEAYCEDCEKTFTSEEWGECHDMDEAKAHINEHIENYYQ